MTELRGRTMIRNPINKWAKGLCAKRLAAYGLSLDDLVINNERIFRRVMWYGSLGAGLGYEDGDWAPKDMDLTEFMTRVVPSPGDGPLYLCPYERWVLFKQKVKRFFRWNPQSIALSRNVAREHYSIHPRIYELFMLGRMKYTAASLADGATEHGEAQDHMLHRVAKKLGFPKKGEGKKLRVLELGSGWGVIARFYVEHYDVEIVAVCNTPKQHEYAQANNAHDDITYVLSDYRELTYEDEFDCAYSFGLIEHIGADNYQDYHRVVHRSLKPVDSTGRRLSFVDFITGNFFSTIGDFYLNYRIFRGGMSPSIGQFLRSIEGLFAFEHAENNGFDYGWTIEQWLEMFNAAWEEIKALDPKYDEKFRRMWEFYFCMCIAAFRKQQMYNVGIVMSKLGEGEIKSAYRFPTAE